MTETQNETSTGDSRGSAAVPGSADYFIRQHKLAVGRVIRARRDLQKATVEEQVYGEVLMALKLNPRRKLPPELLADEVPPPPNAEVRDSRDKSQPTQTP